MSIYDKISNAQETTWLTDGIAEAEAGVKSNDNCFS